jgi:hypothetical protein
MIYFGNDLIISDQSNINNDSFLSLDCAYTISNTNNHNAFLNDSKYFQVEEIEVFTKLIEI